MSSYSTPYLRSCRPRIVVNLSVSTVLVSFWFVMKPTAPWRGATGATCNGWGPGGRVGGVPERGELGLVLGRNLPRKLEGVVVGPSRPVEVTRGGRESQRIGGVGRPAESCRLALVEHRHPGPGGDEGRVSKHVRSPAVEGDHRVVGEEVEQLVLLDRPADREGEVVDVFRQGVGGAGLELHGRVPAAPPARRGVPGDVPLEIVGARLDDGVDDPPRGLSILGLETAGLDLNLVQEFADHPRPEGAVDDVVRADPPEAGVGDVDTIDQVGVLESGRPADRVVALAC